MIETTPGTTPLALSLSAADLATETGLDGRHGTARTTGVTGDEVQAVFTFVEFGVWTAAGLAGNVFDFCFVSKAY